MYDFNLSSIQSQMEKRAKEMQPLWDEISERNDEAFNSLIETAKQLEEINNRLDKQEKENAAILKSGKRQFAITLVIGIISALAAVVGAIFAVLTFFS